MRQSLRGDFGVNSNIIKDALFCSAKIIIFVSMSMPTCPVFIDAIPKYYFAQCPRLLSANGTSCIAPPVQLGSPKHSKRLKASGLKKLKYHKQFA